MAKLKLLLCGFISLQTLLVFAEVPEALMKKLDSAWSEFQSYVAETPEPQIDGFKVHQEKIEKSANEILLHEDVVQEEKEKAVSYKLSSLNYGVSRWTKAFLAKFKLAVKELVKIFPVGSSTAAIAEANLIYYEEFPKKDFTEKHLLARLEEFAQTYPDSPFGPLLIRRYAENLLDKGHLDRVRDLIRNGLKIYPDNKHLKKFQNQVEMLNQPVLLSGPLFDGADFDIQSLKGKVVVLEFWASWCKPCVKLYPKLKSIYDDYKDLGVEFVGFSLDFKAEDLKAYLEEKQLPWPTIYYESLPERKKVLDAFGISGIPHLFLINKEGKLVSISLGQDEKKIRTAIEKQLQSMN